jgi:hypothetical protein
MRKSYMALQFSLERIAKGQEFVYLWTFTLPVKLPVPDACALWTSLCRELVRKVGFSGVRVYEMHPGGHGLHVHCVVGERYDVNDVREVCKRIGWGRVHVKAIASENAGYVGKYLRKAKRCEELRGRRLWAPFGPFRVIACRVRNVEVDSPQIRIYRRLDVPRIAHAHGLTLRQGQWKAFQIARRHCIGLETAWKWFAQEVQLEMPQMGGGGVLCVA